MELEDLLKLNKSQIDKKIEKLETEISRLKEIRLYKGYKIKVEEVILQKYKKYPAIKAQYIYLTWKEEFKDDDTDGYVTVERKNHIGMYACEKAYLRGRMYWCKDSKEYKRDYGDGYSKVLLHYVNEFLEDK